MSALDTEDIERIGRTKPTPDASRWPVIAERQFILATRDTGYRNLPAAVAELIDNALQAGASFIDQLAEILLLILLSESCDLTVYFQSK